LYVRLVFSGADNTMFQPEVSRRLFTILCIAA